MSFPACLPEPVVALGREQRDGILNQRRAFLASTGVPGSALGEWKARPVAALSCGWPVQLTPTHSHAAAAGAGSTMARASAARANGPMAA
jgi:hypothetical protein